MRRLIALLTIALSLGSTAKAFPVKGWQPDELYEKSDVIVIATIKQISPKKKESSSKGLKKLSPSPDLVIRQAKLDIIHVIKGKANRSSTLEYYIPNPNPSESVTLQDLKKPRWPFMGIQIVTGRIYVLYLKSTPQKDVFRAAVVGFFSAKHIGAPARDPNESDYKYMSDGVKSDKKNNKKGTSAE